MLPGNRSLSIMHNYSYNHYSVSFITHRRTRKARRRRMMLPGMGSARDSSDMDTAAAAGARARALEERGQGMDTAAQRRRSAGGERGEAPFDPSRGSACPSSLHPSARAGG